MIQNTYKQMGDNDVIKRNLWNMPCVFVLDEDESHYFHSWETTECTMDGGWEETISITTEMFHQAWDEHSWQLSIDLQ